MTERKRNAAGRKASEGSPKAAVPWFKRCLLAVGKALTTIAFLAVSGWLIRCGALRLRDGNLGMHGAVGVVACFAGILLFHHFPLIPLYIFGHELIHWFTAKLFRLRTGRIRLRRNQGSVEIDHPNVWVILAPYFVPFYALLFLGMLGQLYWFVPQPPPWVGWLAAILIGLSYGYHIALTWRALRMGQEDLRIHGVLFSLSLIAMMNLLLLYGGIRLLV